ncbi:MAG: nucleotidyl transferase AbiEii/AbiGii toxin family protein [Anaerolineales bacterium]
MKYKSGSAFRRALEDHLRAQSRSGRLPLFRLRKLVVFDRLLARLNATSPDSWVLKGGFALQLHFGVRSRTTKDIDLLLRRSVSPAWDMLRQAGATELGDWFAFEIGRPQAEALHDQGGQRFPVHSLLDGRTFERFHMDVGTGDPVLEPPEILNTPDLLAFAEIDPVPFPTYPLTQQIAEKLHAYTRRDEGTESTRVRDLVDILLIAGRSTFNAGKLSAAIHATFEARATHALPAQMPEPPSKWGPPFRRSADELGLAWKDLDEAAGAARGFIDPLLGDGSIVQWDPKSWSWS